MNVEIYVVCHHCLGYNKHKDDEKDLKQTRFDNFSDAWNHKLENPDHWMSFETYIEDENKQ